ncbi:MAG TPA: alpha/beta fold hydrolase [Stellaceae bacterium]|jgi:pimeloyl-ACP methyl ester carboxylesterase|nr:alpha/beta fold hydrolase [Stellaceae bacterium]
MINKPSLVLVPGLLCDAALWRGQVEDLADIAQPWVADVTRDDSMTAMARRVLAEAPPGRFALAGLSMGGYVAQAIIREAPERVERVALLDTSAMADTPEQTVRRRGLIDLAEKGEFHGVTPRLLPLFVHPDRLSDKPLTDAVMAMTERVGKDAFLRQQQAIIGRPDNRPNLPKIKCPALVLCGRQDQMTPLSWSEEIASLIPGARLEIIEDCGHLTTMERPWETSVALRQWLTE